MASSPRPLGKTRNAKCIASVPSASKRQPQAAAISCSVDAHLEGQVPALQIARWNHRDSSIDTTLLLGPCTPQPPRRLDAAEPSGDLEKRRARLTV
jgi:hypothetical protein